LASSCIVRWLCCCRTAGFDQGGWMEKVPSQTANTSLEDGRDVPLIDGELARTLSTAELEGIKAALGAIDEQRLQLETEGLSRISFCLGSLNVMATTFVLAKLPEWLWVMYGIKCLILIPAWFVRMSKIYSGALFILDFCWVVNICFGAYMIASLFGAVPHGFRRSAFLAFYSCALGPLGWASIALKNGLIYHSVEKIASVFIHVTPTLVAWTLVAYPEEVSAAWPGRFPGAAELRAVTALEVYLHGVAAYLAWLVLHGLWLLSVGVNCPEKGHNTVFADLYSKHELGQAFERMTGFKAVRCHAALYLAIHCFAVCVMFGSAAACFKLWELHLVFALLLVVAAAWNGASYYEYIFAHKYTKVVQQLLSEREH